MSFSIEKIRQRFPALSLIDDGKPRIYLDNPGGTQVPLQVIQRMREYLVSTNANHGGHFRTSIDSDQVLKEAHAAMADFLNAGSPNEIIFGPNMTTLTFGISRSLAKWFKPGDEIIVTRMDHDANIMPWVQIAADYDLKIKWLDFNPELYRFDLTCLGNILNQQTKLLAVNYASNALGTINDVKKITEMAHTAGALVYVDAVQYVPHGPTDVRDLQCDFLVCSPYKFFGPHQGVLWGRYELLEKLAAYKVRPADDEPPGKFETGTQSHEGQAGTLGALEYLAWIGKEMAQEFHAGFKQLSSRAKYLHAAMQFIKENEKRLSACLIEGLQEIPGVKIRGITAPGELDDRVPTISFTIDNFHPADITKRLASKNIFTWDGNYYALEVTQRLGLEENGGMLRVGAVHYNTIQEIDTFLSVLRSFLRSS